MSEVLPGLPGGKQLLRPKTRIVLSDERVLTMGHSVNPAACVAITATVQTFARIANELNVLKQCTLVEDPEPMYDCVLVPGETSARILAGLKETFDGILSQVPESLYIQDVRKRLAVAR